MPGVIDRLNTPMKRAAGLTFLIGAAWWFAGSLYASGNNRHYDLGTWWEVATRSYYNNSDYWYIAWATYMTFGGLALSFAYDIGLGRVVKWIRGTPADDTPVQ